jgi:hypothetical protein
MIRNLLFILKHKRACKRLLRDELRAMRRRRRSGLLRTEPRGVSALREPDAIAGERA